MTWQGLPPEVSSTFRVDNCNSLLAGISESNCHQLQCVQNMLAHVVSEKQGTTTSHVLRVLPRLPVCLRVSFKLATLVFKIWQTRIPEYLTPCPPAYIPSRTLRSSSQGLLATLQPWDSSLRANHSFIPPLPYETTCWQTSDKATPLKFQKAPQNIYLASPTTLWLVPSSAYEWLDDIWCREMKSSTWLIDVHYYC